MEIRRKLTLQFCGIVGLIMALFSVSIYLSFAKYRQDEFYDRLERKVKAVAQMLIDIEEVDAGLLKKIEGNNPTNLPNEKIIIFDYNNEILYSSDEQRGIQYTPAMLDQIRLSGSMKFRQGRYEALGIFYTGKYDRFVGLAAATDIYGLQKLKNLRIILLIAFSIGIIIIFYAGRIFSRRALQPIARVMDEVDRINVSNLNEQVSEGNGKDEIARLAKTFNRMLRRLEAAFAIQKNFIANASHELRTPLTAITSQLEVILMSPRTTEVYRNTLVSILDDIRNLGDISNKLLLLVQASDDSAKKGFSEIRIDDVIWQSRAEVLKRNPEYRIHTLFSENMAEESCLKFYGHESLLRTAFVNLMENGCKYSPQHAVELFLDHKNSHIELSFRDEGIGVPDQDSKLIFQPFFRSKNTMKIKGHGIGLSLAGKIVELHKGEIRLKSEVNKGSVFTVILPS